MLRPTVFRAILLGLVALFSLETAVAAPVGVAPRTLDEATAALAASRWDEAARLYRALANENPQQGRFWYNLGDAEYNAKRYRDAADAYARAAAVGHNAGSAHYNRACCLALLGEAATAVDALELAIRSGLRRREDLIRTDSDLASIRDTPEFRARILPVVPENADRVEGWRTDLAYLTRRVAETHYDPFRHISRPEWDAEIARISAALPALADHQVIVALMQLVVRINDGHTVVGAPRQGRFAFHAIPVDFYDFKDGLFVRAASHEYAHLVGQRLVRIGTLPAADALARVATTAQRDNAQQVRWMAARYLSRLEVLDALGISKGLESVEVTVADAAGRETRVTVKAAALAEMHGGQGHAPATGLVDMAHAASAPMPLWRQGGERLYVLEYLAEPRIVYAHFRAVLDDSSETLAQFAARVMEQVSSRGAAALVIDVRDNNGGNNFLGREFFERIQASAMNEHGKLFVIIGRETFSACQNFCNWLDRHTEAIFVGEPTGSRPNFVGEGNPIQLPYTGLTVNASSRFWQDSVSEDARLWIAPDLGAEMTSEDCRQNHDPALAAILEYVRVRASRIH